MNRNLPTCLTSSAEDRYGIIRPVADAVTDLPNENISCDTRVFHAVGEMGIGVAIPIRAVIAGVLAATVILGPSDKVSEAVMAGVDTFATNSLGWNVRVYDACIAGVVAVALIPGGSLNVALAVILGVTPFAVNGTFSSHTN